MKKIKFELNTLEEKSGYGFVLHEISIHYKKEYRVIYVGLNVGSYLMISLNNSNLNRYEGNSNKRKFIVGKIGQADVYINLDINPFEVIFYSKKDIRKEKLQKINNEQEQS
jgi:hypothetical protein